MQVIQANACITSQATACITPQATACIWKLDQKHLIKKTGKKHRKNECTMSMIVLNANSVGKIKYLIIYHVKRTREWAATKLVGYPVTAGFVKELNPLVPLFLPIKVFFCNL